MKQTGASIRLDLRDANKDLVVVEVVNGSGILKFVGSSVMKVSAPMCEGDGIVGTVVPAFENTSEKSLGKVGNLGVGGGGGGVASSSLGWVSKSAVVITSGSAPMVSPERAVSLGTDGGRLGKCFIPDFSSEKTLVNAAILAGCCG